MHSAALPTRPMRSTRISSRRPSCSKKSRSTAEGLMTPDPQVSEEFVPRESYVHGNSGPPLIGKTIGALLDELSATDGTREALVVAHQKIRWTYSELKLR